MKLRPALQILLAACLLQLSSCGGSAGGGLADTFSGGGIGGTGIVSSGTIDGFGSIFVNGVEFETDVAVITIDGAASTEAALGLGMVVLVTGTVNADGITGTADSVVFNDEAEGPITAIAVSADGDTKTLSVLNLQVIVDRTGTVFDGFSFDDLREGDVVEVSGFASAEAPLEATRIEKKSDFVPGVSAIEIQGVVENLGEAQFSLGVYTVDFSAADLSGLPGGEIVAGALVEVKGTLDGTLILAVEIELEEGIEVGFEDEEELNILGTVSSYVSPADFLVNGIAVDGSAAESSPEGLQIFNGMIIEVKGRWDGTTLIAEELELRGGELQVRAQVAAVDTDTSTLQLQLFSGLVSVRVDGQTQMEDKTEVVEPLTLADIAIGDFLLVQGLAGGDAILAEQIDRDDPEDDLLQGPLQAFTSNSSVTLLGIEYGTEGASFKNDSDEALNQADFYAELEIGTPVRIVDERVTDGIADKVKLEDD